ncbi:MAG: hypothetical protein GOV01_03140 [Candidatus Altiarchaeota archaeon]|nr:hypothetical protein [Candidatus Altiarchaeota archaeon]
MNKLLLLILVGVAVTAFTIPFAPITKDLIRVDVYTSDQRVVYVSDEGILEFGMPDDALYSSDDPYDFFPELIDPSSLQRVEFLPYGSEISCNVLDAQGKNTVGNPEFCVVLNLKLGVPVYVHKDLFTSPEFTSPGNLKV